MVDFFLRAFNVVRRMLRRFCGNVGERFLILFQLIYERVKYRGTKTRHIWKSMRNDMQAGSIWLPQMAHGKGAFGDNTDKVLRYIRRAKRVPLSKRKNITM